MCVCDGVARERKMVYVSESNYGNHLNLHVRPKTVTGILNALKMIVLQRTPSLIVI